MFKIKDLEFIMKCNLTIVNYLNAALNLDAAVLTKSLMKKQIIIYMSILSTFHPF